MHQRDGGVTDHQGIGDGKELTKSPGFVRVMVSLHGCHEFRVQWIEIRSLGSFIRNGCESRGIMTED